MPVLFGDGRWLDAIGVTGRSSRRCQRDPILPRQRTIISRSHVSLDGELSIGIGAAGGRGGIVVGQILGGQGNVRKANRMPV